MKKNDITAIIGIVIIAGFISYFVANVVFKPGKHDEQVEVAQPITDEFKSPSKVYFNKDSINPTRQITIGDSDNPDPFGN